MSDHYDRYNGMDKLLGTNLAEAGTNLISRAAAQTELQLSARRYTVAHEAHGEGRVVWSEDLISVSDAMDVLRKIPPAQPTFDARDTQYNLPIGTDLISRAQAIDAARDWYEGLICGSFKGLEKRLRSLPPAQPEIIRCKDCKYNATSKKCLNPNSFFLVPTDDDFCSYAEKREVTT